MNKNTVQILKKNNTLKISYDQNRCRKFIFYTDYAIIDIKCEIFRSINETIDLKVKHFTSVIRKNWSRKGVYWLVDHKTDVKGKPFSSIVRKTNLKRVFFLTNLDIWDHF